MKSRAEYLHRRAREEDVAASRAECEKARELHEELASRYREAAVSDDVEVELETVKSTVPREFRILE